MSRDLPRIGPASDDGAGITDSDFLVAYKDLRPDWAQQYDRLIALDLAAEIVRTGQLAGRLATRDAEHAEAVAALRLRSGLVA